MITSVATEFEVDRVTIKTKRTDEPIGMDAHVMVTHVTVTLGKHSETDSLVEWYPFFEWRLRRTIERLIKRIFLLVKNEKGWIAR